MAASRGHAEIIKYLQSKGCDVSVKEKIIDLLSEALHMTLTSHPLDCRYLIISVCPPLAAI
jgi:hypothetical protein